MPTRAQTLLSRIEDKARKGNRGDPVGTVAFYGPNDESASKVVVGISPSPNEGVTDEILGEASDVCTTSLAVCGSRGRE